MYDEKITYVESPLKINDVIKTKPYKGWSVRELFVSLSVGNHNHLLGLVSHDSIRHWRSVTFYFGRGVKAK